MKAAAQTGQGVPYIGSDYDASANNSNRPVIGLRSVSPYRVSSPFARPDGDFLRQGPSCFRQQFGDSAQEGALAPGKTSPYSRSVQPPADAQQQLHVLLVQRLDPHRADAPVQGVTRRWRPRTLTPGPPARNSALSANRWAQARRPGWRQPVAPDLIRGSVQFLQGITRRRHPLPRILARWPG